MKKHVKEWFLLLLIVVAGAYLRLDRITSIPPSLSHDETAIAYNAYSILTTGKDEYGISYPLLFRSFDDYKLPGMVYATVPWVKLFGLTERAARTPSALFGILSVIVMYGIAFELTKSRKAALFPALMFALSPWHINFSRQLFESNGAVFWFMAGTYFLLKSIKKYPMIIVSGICYVAALYFYYSVRLVIPFIGLLYLVMHGKTMKTHIKTTAVAVILSLAIFAPLGREMLSPGGMERISIVSVVNDQQYLKRKEAYVAKMGVSPTVWQKIVYNRRVALLVTVLENYSKNISPQNLFMTGTGTYGALYPFEAILFPLGLVALSGFSRFGGMLVLVWLITAFLPGAFSVNQPNTLRTLVAAPAFSLLSGLGILYALRAVRKNFAPWGVTVAAGVLMFLFISSFPKFHYAYFVDNPTNNALAFGDGYKQMVEYVMRNGKDYDRIYISGYHWRPYIFLLYWGKVNPAIYQRSGTREQFGKYLFSGASWDTNGLKFMDASFSLSSLPREGKTLYILAYSEYLLHQKELTVIGEIHGVHTPKVFVAATLSQPQPVR